MTAPEHDPAVETWTATARDAQTWGATASARERDEVVRVAEAANFPTCEAGCSHRWHGLKCTACDCETSWTNEKESA